MQQPIIEQIQKSNFSRRALLQLGEKLITLPSYGTIIQKPIDLKTCFLNGLYKFPNLNYICGPIHLLHSVIEEKETRRDLLNAFGDPVEKEYLELRKKIWFEDTFCDGLYYSSFEDKLKDFQVFSKELRDFLSSVNIQNYNQKFSELRGDNKLYMRFINEFVAEQTNLRMDFIMPPVPVIFNDSPNYMIDICFDLIKTTAILADTKADKPSAIFLVIHANNFKKPEILNKFMEKLYDESTQEDIGKINFVVVKIIESGSIESETAGTRIRLNQFLTTLSNYCSNTKRNLIFLDCNSIGLVSVALGVDVFVEQMTGISGIAYRKSKDKHGRYYHPDALKTYSYDDIKQIYANTGSLPCDCKFCKSVNVDNLDEIKMPEWWDLRRSHLIAARNEEIKECSEAIQHDIITNAMMDKIQRSEMKNLLDMLPK